ncbi:hypothetical protein B0H67DRAFT_590041 [Lasiosphaeris hirsuta]|uniref:Flavin-nucleotide-binding protein n=1 Tax=Lasiosphaeris hirsuta TaxID=260670 RepID=A0AA40A2Z4_9PEZI|nr:hypothetical protein B0H67DRAFT_590041 [Lasiosphaeris hirsuta]
MPRQELEYPNEPYSTVKRLSARGRYSLKTIHQIVNSSHMLHVSFNSSDSPFPAILPMIGQMGSFDRPSADLDDVLELYLHGYVSSRIINLTRATPSDPSTPKGLPLSVAASHVDGLVLALTPNSHSLNYRSAVLFGHATLVTDVAEKLYAMELITNAIVPDRWRHTRVPPNAAEMQSTSVLRMRIATGSAKIRTGAPHDERGDIEDEELLERVWTGVVPMYQVFGEPVSGPYNKVEGVPGYLGEYAREANADSKRAAEEALVEEAPKKGSGAE